MEYIFFLGLFFILAGLIWLVTSALIKKKSLHSDSTSILIKQIDCCSLVIMALIILEICLFFGLQPSPQSQETVLHVMVWFMLTGAQLLFFIYGLIIIAKFKLVQGNSKYILILTGFAVFVTDIFIIFYLSSNTD